MDDRPRQAGPAARLTMERLDAFMARASAAYYATQDPFRDFTTSPEVTQVFGELLGGWAAVVWETMGRPDPVTLAECGPGRGTLMADALRAAEMVPAFRAALRVHLVETSPRLRAIQAGRLPAAAWHDTLDAVPPGALLLLGNEFLDALPIRQFVRRGDGWAERWVQDGRFIERPARPGHCEERSGAASQGCQPTIAALDRRAALAARDGTGEGEVREFCEPARVLVASLSRRLMAQGGAALFLDYGPAASAPGDSLQAIRGGKPVDPLADPGQADLTAHVDFAALASTARSAGAAVHGPIPQGKFLARLGLFQRSGQLARTQPPARAGLLMQAAQRLAEPDRMGGLFKALCLCHPSLPTPPGFEQ